MDMTLHQINENLLAVIEGGFVFDTETGEVLFDEDNINELCLKLEDKLMAYQAVAARYDDNVVAIKAEKKRLSELEKVYSAQSDRLKSKMLDSLKKVGNSIELPTMKFSIRHSTSTEVLDMDMLPAEYKKVKYEADKTAIKNAIKSGIMVPGAALLENESLTIR